MSARLQKGNGKNLMKEIPAVLTFNCLVMGCHMEEQQPICGASDEWLERESAPVAAVRHFLQAIDTANRHPDNTSLFPDTGRTTVVFP